jgi:hypothetical protein
VTGVPGGCNYLQALHGFDPSVTGHDHRFGGCENLKNIYFIVKSALWPQRPRLIDPATAFRPATSSGLTKGQARYQDRLKQDRYLVLDEIELGHMGGNVWVDERMPAISLVSFSKRTEGPEYRICDGIVVSRKEFLKLRSHNCKFIKGVERNAGCQIIIPNEMHDFQQQREIGFWGMRKNVNFAKWSIEKRLGRF